jgi:hypothetical protein
MADHHAWIQLTDVTLRAPHKAASFPIRTGKAAKTRFSTEAAYQQTQ